MNEHFKSQIEQGAKEMFFYALESADQADVRIKSHKGTIDTFPDLVYIRHLTDSIPLFKAPQ